MGKLSGYAKAILIVVLKLILSLLKKRVKSEMEGVKDDRKSCLRTRASRKYVSSSDKSGTSDSSIASASKLSLSSGIGSSMCSIDSHSTSSQEDELFDFESPEISSFAAEIERLRTENKVLREKLSRKQVGSRNSQPTDFAERSFENKKGSSSVCQAMSSTPLTTTSEDYTGDDMDDVILEELKLKHKLEKEENNRLQNYINDVMYMVLETRPNLLEK